MFIPSCLGTSSHVLFSIRARNSSSMALFQSGLERASVGDLGRGEIDELTLRLRGCFGLKMPDIDLVVTVRVGGAGGGGDVEWEGRGEVGDETVE